MACVCLRKYTHIIEAGAVIVGSWGFYSVFHNPMCGVVFQCGCTWNWAGGWAKCNVHNPTGPRCPWCVAPRDYTVWAWTASDGLCIFLMIISWFVVAFAVSWVSSSRKQRQSYHLVHDSELERSTLPSELDTSSIASSWSRDHKSLQHGDWNFESGSAVAGGRGSSFIDVECEDNGTERTPSTTPQAIDEGNNDPQNINCKTACCRGELQVKARSSACAVWGRRAAPFITFLAHQSLVGLAFTLATGYPYWFWYTFAYTQPATPPLPPVRNVTL